MPNPSLLRLAFRLCFWCLLWLPVKVALGGESSARLVQRRADAATVGVYCSKSEDEKYYGTGVTISPDGYVLTSTTVVPAGAGDIYIYLTDHTRLEAELVESDATVEATLLKVKADRPLPYLPAALELPEVGETAYTLGNAKDMIRLGAQASFSVGVISGIYEVKSADGQSSYAGTAIETDAAINPGQDGGPLLNCRGQVAGIVSLSYSSLRCQGTAVPLGEIVKQLPSLRQGKVKLDTVAVIEPLPEETAAGSKLAQAAAGVAECLVVLRIERKYGAETLPQQSWSDYRAGRKDWNSLSESRRQAVAQEFQQAETTLDANRQLRRPEGRVTGLAISADGLILTSAFNLVADPAFIRKGAARPDRVEYKGSLRRLVEFDEEDYDRKENAVVAITAVYADGREAKAEVVAQHLPLGLTVLRAEIKGAKFLDLDKSCRAPELGDAVAALGVSDRNGKYTFNTGIVSSAERDDGREFQFDALLNFGNSGGPVVGSDGKLLGLATAPMRPGPALGRVFPMQMLQVWSIAPNSGIGFGARADRIAAELPSLVKGESVDKIKGAYAGIAPDPKENYTDKVAVGVVQAGSPAAAAGLRKGDVLRELDGTALHSWKQLIPLIQQHQPGDKVKLRVERKSARGYLDTDAGKIFDGEDLERFFLTAKDGQEFNGKFVKLTDGVFEVELELGERK